MDYSQEQYFRMQQCGNKIPFYMTYPMQNLYMTELEYQKDMERMKELYPAEVRRVQELVDEECDKMEYEGSLMFDEYPDRLMLRRICSRICAKLEDNVEATQMQGRRMPPPRPERPMPPPPPRNNGLANLVEVLLYNEMYNRRCRYRRCRHWW